MYRKSAKERSLIVGEVLLIGCEGAGKTLLCRHLEKIGKGEIKGHANVPLDPSTQPSIGIEMIEVPCRSRKIGIREIGGTMQPVWDRYFDGCSAVMLVADSSTAHAAASAAVELAELLRAPTLTDKRVMLLLNKRDAPGALPEASLRQLLGIPAFEAAAGLERLSVMPTSALTGEGLPQLLDWCYESCEAYGAVAAAAFRDAAEKVKSQAKAAKEAAKANSVTEAKLGKAEAKAAKEAAKQEAKAASEAAKAAKAEAKAAKGSAKSIKRTDVAEAQAEQEGKENSQPAGAAPAAVPE